MKEEKNGTAERPDRNWVASSPFGHDAHAINPRPTISGLFINPEGGNTNNIRSFALDKLHLTAVAIAAVSRLADRSAVRALNLHSERARPAVRTRHLIRIDGRLRQRAQASPLLYSAPDVLTCSPCG